MALQSNSDWASLPEDLLNSILDHLAPIADCIRFSAVCSQWRRVACETFGYLHHRRPHQHQLPLLMVPTPDNSTDKRSLYDVRRKSLYEFQLKVPYNIRCGGSSHGWLIFVDDSFEVTLLNPFSGKTIHLPPIKRLAFEKRIRDEIHEMSVLSNLQKYEYEKQLRKEYGEEEIPYVLDLDEDEIEIYDDSEESEESENEQEQDTEDDEDEGEEIEHAEFNKQFYESSYSILRGVLSTNPELNPDKFILMVIYGEQERLAFFKSGDKYWNYIDKNICDFFEATYSPIYSGAGLWYWKDIIYSNGLFYALDNLGVLLCCEVGKNLKVKIITPFDRLHNKYSHKTHLVESFKGDLLRVIKVYDDYRYKTIKFVVYKLIDSLGNVEWMEVNTLDNGAVFVGDNHSTCILASNFDGCQSDSIYYSADCTALFVEHEGPKDFGVYNLQDQRITKHYTLAHSQRSMPPPIWIFPTFL